MRRRTLLLATLPVPAAAQVRRGRVLSFPRDHGSHAETRTEWWYATGWCGTPQAPTHGVQVTFFRSRTGLAEGSASRFAARQLLFAHAAVTDLAARRHVHAQRIARWSGQGTPGTGFAAEGDARVQIGDWRFVREGGGYAARLADDALDLQLTLAPTQPVLLQGDAGFSRKGPEATQASHYYSEPQLALAGRVGAGGAPQAVQGRAWLDHEWSDEYLHPGAAGWDWIGMNLFDGSALMAFRIRGRDGSVLWAGGAWRAPGAAARAFTPGELRFSPGRTWRSPATNALYPTQWQVETPAGRFEVNALLDAQELDSRGNTGAVYWEGLSELKDGAGRRVGLGYLELTGYAAALKM